MKLSVFYDHVTEAAKQSGSSIPAILLWSITDTEIKPLQFCALREICCKHNAKYNLKCLVKKRVIFW